MARARKRAWRRRQGQRERPILTAEERKDRDRARRRELYAESPTRRARQQAATRRWVEANPERVKANGRRWVRENIEHVCAKATHRRALKLAVTLQEFTTEQLDARMSVFGHRCAYCGGPFEEVDHVKPLSRGGPHCLANLRPACTPCNRRKWAKSPSEWRPQPD